VAEAILRSGYECFECGNLVTSIDPLDFWECSLCETRYLYQLDAERCCPDEEASR
jgi:DNA-directed RNA polymerase subunit RPC12/RpoP